MDSMKEGLCLDTMTLHAMCISGSNLESKMQDAVQCFMEDGEAAARRHQGRGKGKKGKGKGKKCPTFEELTEMMTEEMGSSECFLQSLGWIDENGEDVNATITKDIASLNPEISAQLTGEVIGECVMEFMGKMAENPMYAKCADKYTEEESLALEEIGMKIVAFKCFTKTFDESCKSYIQSNYVEPLLSSFNLAPMA